MPGVRSRSVAVALVAGILVLAGSPSRAAEESRDAAAATAPGRSLDRALDQALAHGPHEAGAQRQVILLVDATRNLRDAAFHDRLEQAFDRKAKAIDGVTFGLGLIGEKGTVVVPPGQDRAPVLAELGKALTAATGSPIRNVFADVRAAASAFASGSAERELVVVSLDNGDAEDDLEATVRALVRAKVTCTVIARESFLADSWALSHAGQVQVPKGVTLAGGDGAWASIPWGWLFQQQTGHEVAPSGFAAYGLTRLAAATGGRVHLYAGTGGKHVCAAIGVCPACTGDHIAPGEVYESHRLEALAPSAAARSDVLEEDAHDPWLRVTLALWSKASKEGLVRSRPTASLSGSTLEIEKRVQGQWPQLLGTSLAFPRLGSQAAKLRAEGDRLLEEFETDLAKIEPTSGSQRHRAGAELTRVMLHLTLANLVQFEGFCQEAGPAMCGKPDRELLPPEVPRLGDDQRAAGLSYTAMCLCHGTAPFRSARLGGGAAFAARLDALDKVLEPFFARYDHTPYGVSVRRSGIAQFLPTVRGTTLPPPPRSGGSSETDPGATTPDRPDRGGGDSSSGGGTTTPGGK